MAGALVRGLGLGVLAAEPVQLTEGVVGVACRGRRRAAGEPVGRTLGLDVGLRPTSVQGQDLGSVHEAVPAIGHEIALRVAPPGQGRGPLLSAPYVEDVLTAL